MRAAFFLIAPALLFSAPAGRAQTPAPPPDGAADQGRFEALTSLRARYAESMGVADRAAYGQLAESLALLEKKRAVEGDYACAERIRQRREEILAIAGANDGRAPVRLNPSESKSLGSGLTHDQGKTVINFNSRGAFVLWEKSGDFNGWYEVQLTHAVDGRRDRTAEITPDSGDLPDKRNRKSGQDSSDTHGGWVAFQNVSGLTSGARRNDILHREIVSTGGQNEWVTVSMGKIHISGSIATLKLTAEDALSEGLMRLRCVELVPANAPSTVTSTGSGELAKLRAEFDTGFRIKSQKLTETYKLQLTKLQQQALQEQDTDIVVRVKEELGFLAKPEQLALGESGAPGSGGAPLVLDVVSSLKIRISGDLSYDSTRTVLTRLRPRASVKWLLAPCNVGSGVYKVEVKGRVPLNGGGEATLTALGKSSSAAGKPLKFSIKPVVSREAKNKKPETGTQAPVPREGTFEAGTVTIAKGAETLTLTVDDLTHGDGWLMDLSSIILTRTGDAPVAGKP